jgi:hypothetical protein
MHCLMHILKGQNSLVCLLNEFLITHLIQPKCFLRAKSLPPSQEISRLLWNAMVHHRVHKSPSPVLILIRLSRVHIL